MSSQRVSTRREIFYSSQWGSKMRPVEVVPWFGDYPILVGQEGSIDKTPESVFSLHPAQATERGEVPLWE